MEGDPPEYYQELRLKADAMQQCRAAKQSKQQYVSSRGHSVLQHHKDMQQQHVAINLINMVAVVLVV
eukprot:8740-Heterococcus_DN1.PRE.1